MVYSNRFVMCVLHDGKPQPETANGIVRLPFSAEYALRFRNKNDRRCGVKLFIDGECVSDGCYVVDAGGVIDIRRHALRDAAFKFVSLDSPDAVEHGKNGPNHDKTKGLIEAWFYLEKERPKPVPMVRPRGWNGPGGQSCGALPSRPPVSMGCFEREEKTSGGILRGMGFNPPLSDGATVEGGSTGQYFRTVSMEFEPTYTVVKLFLQGYDPTTPATLEWENERLRSQLQDLENGKESDLERENRRLRERIAELQS